MVNQITTAHAQRVIVCSGDTAYSPIGVIGLVHVDALCTNWSPDTQEATLRTNIDLDDELMARAMAAAGLRTKKATVEEGLRLLVRRHEQKKAFAELKGMGWEGDLDAMREGRSFAPRT